MDIEIKDSTIEDLSYYAKMIFDEMEARYDDLSALYEALHDDYNELQEKYEGLKKEESEPQYDYNAYNEGFADAYKQAFTKGKQSMQEKVNKLCEYWCNNKTSTIIELFGGMTWEQVFEDIETAYNKVIDYENEKEEIHVGDEVVDVNGDKYIVRKIDDGQLYLLEKNGDAVTWGYSNVSKTGKHYLLEEMLKELE